jgi:hypothetical protein
LSATGKYLLSAIQKAIEMLVTVIQGRWIVWALPAGSVQDHFEGRR